MNVGLFDGVAVFVLVDVEVNVEVDVNVDVKEPLGVGVLVFVDVTARQGIGPNADEFSDMAIGKGEVELQAPSAPPACTGAE